MSRCRWDRDAKDYLVDGKPCTVDEYGDPTRHCRARRSCSNHVGPDELTCARCLGRTRSDIQRIAELSPLMLVQAMSSGVNSEAAMLAGPAADVRHWTARRVAMRDHLDAWMKHGYTAADGRRLYLSEKQWLHARATMEDDDEHHPYTVLTRWQMMMAEDYDLPLPQRLTAYGAACVLDHLLGRFAQDPEQDFGLLREEMRTCREHMETAIMNSAVPERGAPCPDCLSEKRIERLVRHYGHWCEDPDCEREHYDDDSGDIWVCPRDKTHWRSHEDYTRWTEERVLS